MIPIVLAGLAVLLAWVAPGLMARRRHLRRTPRAALVAWQAVTVGGILAALAAAGIDVATMANNHALDFGRDPLQGTFDAMAAATEADPPLKVIGIGRDADEAFRPAWVEVGGSVVATINTSIW